ncbi:GTPase [Sulfodiicoccus acidiphilus]|uniref:GTPase n=1 Tax=Sulfodiicoccus acidiphilus TaxID=1670455 RepID=A0A348B345_9CREN|nr:GTPase [Sulfodiicoccus acidiphilus]
MGMYFIFVTGTAGSGKTTLTASLIDFLTQAGMDVAAANLDPAVERLPYVPDFDVRQYVDAGEIMRKYGLGPNSSLVAATDMALTKATEIREEMDKLRANYVIVDTPGQIELFAYRNSGRMLLTLLSEDSKSVNLFLLDSFLTKEPRSYLSLLLLSSSVKFRLNLPQVNLLSKVDLLTPQELEKITAWSEGEELIDALGIVDDNSYELASSVIQYASSPPTPVSAIEGKGLGKFTLKFREFSQAERTTTPRNLTPIYNILLTRFYTNESKGSRCPGLQENNRGCS